jgi:hypothetical protein
VVSPGSSDAFVIDARTSRSTRIALDEAASRIHLFEAAGPGDPKSRPRALLIGTGLASRSISFLDLDQLETQGRRNLDSRPMGAPALESLFFPARGLAAVLHRAQPAAPGSASSISRNGRWPPSSPRCRPPGSPWRRTRSGSAPRAATDWASSASRRWAPGEVRLDAPISAILPLARAADGKNRVVVVHGADPAGSLTVLDGDKPERATARAVEGFLLQDLLEREDR